MGLPHEQNTVLKVEKKHDSGSVYCNQRLPEINEISTFWHSSKQNYFAQKYPFLEKQKAKKSFLATILTRISSYHHHPPTHAKNFASQFSHLS